MTTQARDPGRTDTDGVESGGGDDPRTVSLDGERRLAYAAYGPPDGIPVVFLHGTPGSRRLGGLFAAAARERGVRILAPDRPGYGRSDPWPTRTVADTATVVSAVLDDANVERAGVVAFSGGGPYALATAANRPDRVEGVDVIAGATPPDATDETPAVQRLLGWLATRTPPVLGGLFRGQAWLADRLDPSVVLAQYTDDPGSIPDEAAKVVAADFVEAVGTHRSGAVTEFRHAASAWDFPLGEVDLPVRFWHGDADANVPIEGVRRLSNRVTGADVEVLPGADHLQSLVRSRAAVLDRHR